MTPPMPPETVVDDAERYPRIVQYVRETPWAILPETLDTIVGVLARRIRGERLTAEEIQARIGVGPARRDPTRAGAVAVIPVYGILAQRRGVDAASRPLTSTDRLGATIRQSLADPAVTALVLDVDSPGGSVYGIPELADLIAQSRGEKPIVAVANAMAASAAYWIASQADEFVVTPSGEVGSIGVLAVHEDFSRQNEQLGVAVSYVTAGKYKAELNPDAPLGSEARAYLQARVDDYHAAFVKAVARGRKTSQRDVREQYGEGRMVGAVRAVTLGMADRVDTLQATLERLGGRPVAPPAAQAARPDPVAARAAWDAWLDAYEAGLPKKSLTAPTDSR